MHPALLTPAKQRKPSLTTVLAELKLRFAKAVISARRKLHAAQLQTDWLALRCGFDRSHDRRLARRTAATLAAVPLAAEIGVVHLDPSRQALHGVPFHHHLHEFVLDLPGCGLGNAKPAPQLNAGDAALALGEVVHGAKPGTQRHLGRGENRSGNQGCLPPTGGTLVKRAALDDAVMLPSADRADEAGWPAPTHHRLPALILRSVKSGKLSLTEAFLKLDFVPCHRSNPQKQSNVRGLYSTLMAEDSP